MEWQAWRQNGIAGELYYDTDLRVRRSGDAWIEPVLLRRQRRRHALLPGHAGEDRRHHAHPGREPAPQADPRRHGGLRVLQGARRRRRSGDGRRRGGGAVAQGVPERERPGARSTPRATASRVRIEELTGQTPPPMGGDRRRLGRRRTAARAAATGGNGATSDDRRLAPSTPATPASVGRPLGCSHAPRPRRRRPRCRWRWCCSRSALLFAARSPPRRCAPAPVAEVARAPLSW